MKILCLTGLFPKEYEQTILDNSLAGVQNAANKFQWGIVKGFDAIPEVEIKILNSLYIGSFPWRYKQIKIPTFEFSHKEGASDLNVGFANLSGYKVLSRYRGMKKEIDKWIEATKGHTQVIIAYAMTSPMVELLHYVKKKYKEIKCCLVVPDLPEYMSMTAKKKSLYSFLKKIQIKHFKKQLKIVDGFVLLTKNMTEWFDWKINYTVIEGICSLNKSDYSEVLSAEKNKAIVYAGGIEEKYGLLELVKAFMKTNEPDWSLELFGNGSGVNKIGELARSDSRIHLRGMVPNADVIEEQKHAEILINPRNDNNEFTKYSFPSKVIEYMSSGTPMIGYKLSGMPDEYTNFFYEIDKTEDGMFKCLDKVMALSSKERAQKGKEAFDFVTTEKNAKNQCEKILKMLDGEPSI